ncbi:MAG: FAD-dependent oxidoreductase [Amaricoccus sp.]|uniref:NAD(P)/FAD-dependent oxidoreductase n=1 Tax=Amaricoccus sp. TaxID=1872485 RepID=UPI0039E52A7C
MADRVVIVGAGQGGFQAAASLRQEGFAGRVTLVGDEPGLPYQRPPLSKAYMKDGDPKRLALRPAGFFAEAGIERVGGWVEEIDRDAGRVLLAGGEALAYDHLILATGARNAMPPVSGLAEAVAARAVVGLRTLADAELMRARIAAGGRAVVIGGGFIGLEFAAVARAAGLDVTVVEAADRLMARVVSPEISEHFLDLHRGLGVDVRLGAAAAAVEPAGVRLASGERVAGGLILLAAGVRPNIELAAAAGITVGNGVVVDGRLVSSDPAVSALGDVALYPGPDGESVRLESVQAAVDHARHIARRVATGDGSDYAAVPWFWSDQGAAKLQIAGLRHHRHRTVAVPGDRRVVLSLAGDVLKAVETVNAPAPHMAARRLLAAGQAVTLSEIEAAGFDLVALAKARA